MDIDEKERLARHRDTSDEAVALRLRAARRAVNLQQKDLAAALKMNTTTLNSQEIKGRPSRKLVEYLYRNHRIDFNFVHFGDFNHLPGDVQSALLSALAAEMRSGNPTDS